MDGSLGLRDDYASWLDASANGRRAYACPMANTHEQIAKVLDKGRYSFEEVVELFAGVVSSRYCFDRNDAHGSIGLFADKLLQMVGKDEHDEDGEMVDSTDAGGE